ncbi:MAG TPA: hypothetical protein VFA77_08915, partial [Candidatus Eisenbacteria bacterium]|nr:hypothetical protein [Candidatus Eisenbacteria bacterium]
MINLPAIPLLGAVFTVRNTSDSGPVSLRQAILDANAAAGEDLIRFEIPGAAPYTINLTSGFPDITDIVMIDGTTQAGYAGKPIIEINGANAGVDVSGLLIRTNNCVVR